jgi:hypothetical protein
MTQPPDHHWPDHRWQRAHEHRTRTAMPKFDSTNARADAKPGWSEGIRALYDAVVQEPLPADFQKLLDELGKKASR